ncbi:hypothetical protein CIC12_25895 [Burkholderia sp. SG-MS1]|nr:hypothetical protein [Paraburkholderia sp. SG-MS1]
MRIGRPLFRRDDTLCFSAYGFGWGYRAFALDAGVAHEVLGSVDPSPRQILLAFGMGHARIRAAVCRAARPRHGERTRLTVDDFP